MSYDPRRQSAGSRRDWRQRSSGGAASGGRFTRRTVFTLAAIGLAVLFVWLLWPQRQRVYMAFLTGYYGPELAQPSKEDEALVAWPLVPDGETQRRAERLRSVLYGPQFAVADVGGKSPRNAAHRLAEVLPLRLSQDTKWRAEQLDLLVLYVEAHGVVIDGEPYLVWDGGQHLDEVGRLPQNGGAIALDKLATLLDGVQALPARRKLLLLDSGRLPPDVRLGNLIHEFPSRLEQTLADEKYKDLWVISSVSPLEISHVRSEDRATLLGHYAVEAVQQHARRGDRSPLTLAAYYKYIHDKVREASGGRQTPMLLVGGEPQRAAPSPQGDVAEERLPRVELFKGIAFIAQPPASDEPAGPADSAARPGPAASEAADPFARIWELCRAIEQPIDDAWPPAWSPIDYAPHLWAHLQRQLLWYQLRYLAEPDKRAENDAYLAAEIIAPLVALTSSAAAAGGAAADTASGQAATGVATPAGRAVSADSSAAARNAPARLGSWQRDIFRALAQARASFARSGMVGDLPVSQPDEALRSVVQAVRLKNYLVFQSARHVRAYGLLDDQSGAVYDALVATIAELAGESEIGRRGLVARLEQFEERLDPLAARRTLDELRRLHADKPLPDVAAYARRIMAWGVAQRSPAVAGPPRLSDADLARRLDLHVRLLRLSVPDGEETTPADLLAAALAGGDRDRVRQQLDELDRAARGRGLREETYYWELYRELSARLRAWHRELPRQITAGGTRDELRRQERRLRLADLFQAGDVLALASESANPIHRRTWWRRVDQIRLLADDVELGPGERHEMKIAYEWTGAPGTRGVIHWEVAPGSPASQTVRVEGEPRQSISLQRQGTIEGLRIVAAASDADGPAGSAVLHLHVESADAPGVVLGSFAVPVRVYGRDFVDLVMHRVEGGIQHDLERERRPDERVAAGGGSASVTPWLLRPLPNRQVQYSLALRNRSGRHPQRSVRVEWFAATQPMGERGTIFRPDGQLNLQRLKPLPQYTAPELTLPLGQDIAYPFANPVPAKADDAAANGDKLSPGTTGAAAPTQGSTAAGGKPDAENEQPPGTDLVHGLVVRIVDRDDPKLQWLHWVDFRARHPAAYVAPSVTYDAASGELKIRIDPIESQPGGGTLAGLAGWEARFEVERLAGLATVDGYRPQGVAEKPTDSVELRADGFRPTQPRVPIYISVDGYPRAFVFLVSADGSVVVPRVWRDLRILTPADHLARGPLESGAPVPIDVELEVDAQPDDQIALTVEGRAPLRLPGARAEHAWLLAAEDGGLITIHATVGDFRGPDKQSVPVDVFDDWVAIRAEILRTAGMDQQRVVSQQRSVIVDTRRPEVLAVEVHPADRRAARGEPVRIVDGQPLRVEVAASDKGGVSSIELFVAPAERQRPQEEDLAKAAAVIKPDEGQGARIGESRWTVTLDPLPAKRRYRIWARATDQVERVSDLVPSAEFSVVEPDVPSDAPKKQPGATVVVTAVFGGSDGNQPRDNIAVTLTPRSPGAPPMTVLTAGEDPVARFENVPPGEYDVTARGKPKGTSYSLEQLGKQTVVVAPGEAMKNASIRLTRARD